METVWVLFDRGDFVGIYKTEEFVWERKDELDPHSTDYVVEEWFIQEPEDD